MSWLSKAVKKVGKGFKQLVTNPAKWAANVGKEVAKAAPLAAVVPGLGTGVALIAGAAGKVASIAARASPITGIVTSIPTDVRTGMPIPGTLPVAHAPQPTAVTVEYQQLRTLLVQAYELGRQAGFRA